jgi:hypothetical protein
MFLWLSRLVSMLDGKLSFNKIPYHLQQGLCPLFPPL